MREVSRQLELPLACEATFALLHTPSAIRGWWSAARAIVAPRARGIWVAAWGEAEDAPDYITVARIVAWEPPRRLRLGEFEYYTREGGLPFEAALETEFSVSPTERGSLLRVHQAGFPDAASADDFYKACERGWAATFDGILRYVAGASAS